MYTNTPYTQSVDTIIMGEVVKTFSDSDMCIASINGLLRAIFSKLPKILLFIVAKKCIESSSSLFEPFINSIKNTFVSILYRKKTYPKDNALSEDFYTARAAMNTIPNTDYPIAPVLINGTDQSVTVSYVPLLHSSIISELENKGISDLNNYKKIKDNRSSSFYVAKLEGVNAKYHKCNNSHLFPSRNYKKLASVIEKHISVSNKIKTNNMLGILIDGVPGLGKTKFADYAVSCGLADEIYKIDMTRFNSVSMKSVIDSAFHKIAVDMPTIFVIDELDKYLDQRLQTEYNAERFNDKIKEKRTYEEFIAYTKQEYLYEILNVLERDDAKAPTVVIFCSNNFLSIFNGIDTTHYKSLYDRFMKFTFEKCDHEELVEYMHYYDSLLRDKSDIQKAISKEDISTSLKKDISITYRDLHHLSIEAMYDTNTMIKLLNEMKIKEDLPINMLPFSKRNNEFVDISANDREQNKPTKTCNQLINTNNPTIDTNETQINEDKENTDESEDESEDKSASEDKVNDQVQHIKDINYNMINDAQYVETFPEHLKTWINDYVKPDYEKVMNVPKENRNAATKKIAELVNGIEGCDIGGQVAVIGQIFTEFETNLTARSMLISHPAFANTFCMKIEEFSKNKHKPLCVLPSNTKKFCYAISGIQIE